MGCSKIFYVYPHSEIIFLVFFAMEGGRHVRGGLLSLFPLYGVEESEGGPWVPFGGPSRCCGRHKLWRVEYQI